MKEQINIAVQRWKFALNDKKFRYSLISFLSIFAVQMAFISQFQQFLETREGVVFIDPITGNMPVLTLDALTFIAIYSAHLLAIILALLKPEKFFQLLLGYLFVYFFRIIAQYLMPLDPPDGIVPLHDPFLIWFSDGQIINKDLFYSGHTSTTFMIFLITDNIKAKAYIFIALLFVIFGILMQRVHYTVDVYAAFFFTFTAYRLGLYIIKKLNFSNELKTN
jgi:hypothetical protein